LSYGRGQLKEITEFRNRQVPMFVHPAHTQALREAAVDNLMSRVSAICKTTIRNSESGSINATSIGKLVRMTVTNYDANQPPAGWQLQLPPMQAMDIAAAAPPPLPVVLGGAPGAVVVTPGAASQSPRSKLKRKFNETVANRKQIYEAGIRDGPILTAWDNKLVALSTQLLALESPDNSQAV
jgi:hypothetical protein